VWNAHGVGGGNSNSYVERYVEWVKLYREYVSKSYAREDNVLVMVGGGSGVCDNEIVVVTRFGIVDSVLRYDYATREGGGVVDDMGVGKKEVRRRKREDKVCKKGEKGREGEGKCIVVRIGEDGWVGDVDGTSFVSLSSLVTLLISATLGDTVTNVDVAATERDMVEYLEWKRETLGREEGRERNIREAFKRYT